MSMLDRLKGRIEDFKYTGPQEAYSKELNRYVKNKDSFERDPEAEKLILKRWDLAYFYAKNVLEDRWPEFEAEMINSRPTTDLGKIRVAASYAEKIVGAEFREVEKHIANDPMTAADYSINVLQRPWIEVDDDGMDLVRATAHSAIMHHPMAKTAYHYNHYPEQYGPQPTM